MFSPVMNQDGWGNFMIGPVFFVRYDILFQYRVNTIFFSYHEEIT